MVNYKFRGLNAQGKWHIGCLIKKGHSFYIRHHNNEYYILTPTIGQFTGIQDVKGNDIYMGDIVRLKNKSYKIIWSQENCSFMLENTEEGSLQPIYKGKFTLIGNIYNKYKPKLN